MDPPAGHRRDARRYQTLGTSRSRAGGADRVLSWRRSGRRSSHMRMGFRLVIGDRSTTHAPTPRSSRDTCRPPGSVTGGQRMGPDGSEPSCGARLQLGDVQAGLRLLCRLLQDPRRGARGACSPTTPPRSAASSTPRTLPHRRNGRLLLRPPAGGPARRHDNDPLPSPDPLVPRLSGTPRRPRMARREGGSGAEGRDRERSGARRAVRQTRGGAELRSTGILRSKS